jgi:Uncharacterized protein conserved in bacteria (DUF2188)
MAARAPGASLWPLKVDVTPDLRGGWDLRFSDRRPRQRCDTLAAAVHLAHQYAEESHPCELVIRDAYHRVVSHEFSGDAARAGQPVNA